MASNTKAKNAKGQERRDSRGRTQRRDSREGRERYEREERHERAERPRDRRLTKQQRKRKRRNKLIGMLALEFVLLLLLGVGVWGISKLDKIQDLDVKQKDILVNDMDDATEEVLKGYTNIALFGIDTRTMGDLGKGNRSDTIMIASINNDTKEVKLVSVYRDTYLNHGDDIYWKCNEAYAKGGPAQAMSMLNQNLDLNIKYFVSVDFLALIRTVDLLGGIEVDVQKDEWEWVNAYMLETTYLTQVYGATLETYGLQTLYGLQATSYCRIRATAGNDFRRTERQRTVLRLIAEKAKKASLGTINSIIDEVFPLIATNIPKTEMLSMAASMMSYEMGETSGFPSNLENVKINKADIVAPADLEYNVRELHRFLFDEEDYYPSPTVLKYSEQISTDTGAYAPAE